MMNFEGIIGFQWDTGNSSKSFLKHGVTTEECEQVFDNTPLHLSDDIKHSHAEVRFLALGKTDEERLIFMAFTVRGDLFRVISARSMNKKERNIYTK